MRSLLATPGGHFRWRSTPAPAAPGPKGAVVHPIAVATCDMDRPIALGKTPFPLPLCFGHECVAEVLSVGSEVATVKPGDRVVVPFQISCGECSACRNGHTSNCLTVPPISMYGFGVSGGHWGGAIADELAVPFADGMLVQLPPGIDPVAAASVADNVSDAFRHFGPHLPGLIEEGRGDEVLIVGADKPDHPFTASVSMYAGLIAKSMGVSRVRVADVRPKVCEQLAGLGLEPIHPRELSGLSVPLVIDMSANPRGLRAAVQSTAPDGICSCVGGLHPNVKLPFSTMYGRNVKLTISRCNARAVIPDVLELVRDGGLHPELVTETVAPIDDAPIAMSEHVRRPATKTIVAEL
jgi:alcohol dehydrogenase